MKKLILFLFALLSGLPVHSTDADIEKRIRELEAELQSLKQAGIKLKANKLKKKTIDQKEDVYSKADDQLRTRRAMAAILLTTGDGH